MEQKIKSGVQRHYLKRMNKDTNSHIKLTEKINSITKDVIERKKIEEVSKIVKPAPVFDGGPRINFVVDAETQVIENVNLHALEQYGFSREEFLQMKLQDLVEGGVDYLAQFKEVNVTGEISKNSQRHITKNGGVLDVEYTAHLITIKGRLKHHYIIKTV